MRSGGQAARRAGASRQRQRRERGKHRSERELQAAESWNDKSSQVLTRSLCPGPLAQLPARRVRPSQDSPAEPDPCGASCPLPAAGMPGHLVF